MKLQYSIIFTHLFILTGWLLLPATGLSQTAPPPREDHQFWNEIQLVKRLTEKQDLVIIGAIRLGRDWHHLVDERIGAGIAFKPNKHVTIQPTYLFISYQPFPGRLINEHRLFLNVTPKFMLGQFTFSDRNLFERRVRQSNPDFLVYRNRLMIDHPARIGKWTFRPFIADEIWWATQSSQGARVGWFRNRFSAGFIKQFNKNLYAEIFYLHQNDGISRPGNLHVIGTFFRYTL